MSDGRLPRGSAATVVGRSHVARGEECQDVALVERIGRRAILAVVSDGAGSASRGGAGAAIVASVAARHLRRLRPTAFAREAGLGIVVAIRSEIETEAAAQGGRARDFAATFLAVLLRQTKTGICWFALHIGDGAIVGDLDGVPAIVSAPQNGEFSNTTYFVTDADAMDRLRTYQGEGAHAAFALMTDGAAESLFHRASQSAAPAVATLFHWCRREKPRAFERALDANLKAIVAPRTSDDVGLAVIAA